MCELTVKSPLQLAKDGGGAVEDGSHHLPHQGGLGGVGHHHVIDGLAIRL